MKQFTAEQYARLLELVGLVQGHLGEIEGILAAAVTVEASPTPEVPEAPAAPAPETSGVQLSSDLS